MRILVTGDRHYDRHDIIHNTFDLLKTGIIINGHIYKLSKHNILIEGGARGADQLAREYCLTLDFTIQTYKADWEQYGKAAGPIRNKQMLMEGKPNILLAFHSDVSQSRGTKHMINVSLKTACPVVLIWGNPANCEWNVLAESSISCYAWCDGRPILKG